MFSKYSKLGGDNLGKVKAGSASQGCQMADGLFSNQNPTLGKFWWALDLKMLI
jgi:hypothetical protein